MREGEIEETVIPQNPLDVLAQHLVSMAALDEWEVDEVERLVTATEPFHDLSREQLENVLDMLDGRYPSDRFAELRPRIVWDRTAGTHPRPQRRPPARRHQRRHDPRPRPLRRPPSRRPPGRRARRGDGLRGAPRPDLPARRDDLADRGDHPRPGDRHPGARPPGAVPFWKGDGIGRPAELGRAIGAFAREAVSREPAELAAEYDLDRRAAENLVAYLREQQAATRVVPSDETIVVERFRDEIGDWRLCVLSPYGGRVHAAWGLALAQKIRTERELEADAIWSDDGIVVHLPDADEPPPADLVMVEPDELEDLVVRELSGSALFGARFRENASRSLLIPRAYPGRRTPLWQQRLKAQSLLEVARDFPRFPVVLETYRECLRDVLDLPSLAQILRDLHSRRISLVEVETPTASPFASSLLFDYVATYMYEGDTPNAERRAAALALDRDLLRELLGQEELRELIDPEALEEVEAQLQHRAEAGPRRRPRRPPADPAQRRRPDRGGVRRAGRGGLLGGLDAGEAGRRAPRRAGPRSAARSATSPPRTPASTATRSACRRRPACRRPSSRTTPTRCAPSSAATPAPTAPSRPRSSPPATASTRSQLCASWSAKAPSCAASCCPAAPSASGATPTCCAACAAPASPTCGARSSPPPATASPASCRAGRTSMPTAPPAPAPTACARRWCRCRASP